MLEETRKHHILSAMGKYLRCHQEIFREQTSICQGLLFCAPSQQNFDMIHCTSRLQSHLFLKSSVFLRSCHFWQALEVFYQTALRLKETCKQKRSLIIIQLAHLSLICYFVSAFLHPKWLCSYCKNHQHLFIHTALFWSDICMQFSITVSKRADWL